MQLKRKSKTSGHFRNEHREYFIGVYTQIGKNLVKDKRKFQTTDTLRVTKLLELMKLFQISNQYMQPIS